MSKRPVSKHPIYTYLYVYLCCDNVHPLWSRVLNYLRRSRAWWGNIAKPEDKRTSCSNVYDNPYRYVCLIWMVAAFWLRTRDEKYWWWKDVFFAYGSTMKTVWKPTLSCCKGKMNDVNVFFSIGWSSYHSILHTHIIFSQQIYCLRKKIKWSLFTQCFETIR